MLYLIRIDTKFVGPSVLLDFEEEGVIQSYTPIVDYGKLGYDVTAILQVKLEGHALPEITERLRQDKKADGEWLKTV